MSERLDKIRELEQQVRDREKMISRVADRKGSHIGPGTLVTCEFCGKRFRFAGENSQRAEPPACPYCGR